MKTSIKPLYKQIEASHIASSREGKNALKTLELIDRDFSSNDLAKYVSDAGGLIEFIQSSDVFLQAALSRGDLKYNAWCTRRVTLLEVLDRLGIGEELTPVALPVGEVAAPTVNKPECALLAQLFAQGFKVGNVQAQSVPDGYQVSIHAASIEEVSELILQLNGGMPSA